MLMKLRHTFKCAYIASSSRFIEKETHLIYGVQS